MTKEQELRRSLDATVEGTLLDLDDDLVESEEQLQINAKLDMEEFNIEDMDTYAEEFWHESSEAPWGKGAKLRQIAQQQINNSSFQRDSSDQDSDTELDDTDSNPRKRAKV